MTYEEIKAEQARVAAEFWARKARLDAIHAEREANTSPTPWVVIGAIAPMSDYHESVERGWSTD
jgi:hypothetical protein